MSGLTIDAAREVERMTAAGWRFRFIAGPDPLWSLTKVVTIPGLGDSVSVGFDPDLFKAVQKALADERKGNRFMVPAHSGRTR